MKPNKCRTGECLHIRHALFEKGDDATDYVIGNELAAAIKLAEGCSWYEAGRTFRRAVRHALSANRLKEKGAPKLRNT